MKPAFLSLLLLLFHAVLSGQSDSTKNSDVSGTVMEQDDRPLANATVFGLPEKDMRHQLRTTTDVTGNFVLKDVPSGALYLDAFKDSAGYPYSFFAFFKSTSETPVKISVDAGKDQGGVEIHLGPKAARLHLEILGPKGAAISIAQLIFTRDDQAGEFRSSLPENQSLLVPAVPFRLVVVAPSFAPWTSSLITLKPGQSAGISVHLRTPKSGTLTQRNGCKIPAEMQVSEASQKEYSSHEDQRRVVGS